MLNVSQLQIGWSKIFSLQPADIVSVRTPGAWMSDMVLKFERDPGEDPAWATHSGLIDHDGYIVEALWRVTRRSLMFYQNKSRVAIVRCPGLTRLDRLAIAADASGHIGQRYGWLKLLQHAFGHRDTITNPDRPICSYLVSQAYDVAASLRFGRPPNECQPDDLLDHAVYNGWPLVWCDTDATLRDLHAVYGDSGEAADDLAHRHSISPPT